MRGRLLCFSLLSCALLGALFSFVMAGISHGLLPGSSVMFTGLSDRRVLASRPLRDASPVSDEQAGLGQWGRWQAWTVVNSAEAQDRENEQGINVAVPRPPKFARIVIKPERSSVFEGVGEPGQRIEVLVDQQDVRQTRVGSDGRWRVTGPALGPGDHRVEVSVGTPGQTRRVIGQRVRIAIPRTSSAREIVAYEQSEAERQAELRARAERLARDASREFDEFGRSSERSRTANREDRNRSARERVEGRGRQAAGGNTPSGNGSDWLSRSARDYFDYVVPELARKGGDGSLAPRGEVPPPVRPGDDDEPTKRTTDSLPSIGELAQGARDWLQRANRTYQDRVVEDLRVGSVDDNELRRREMQEARDRELAERRAARLQRAEEAERRRLEAEERRQRAEAERQRSAEERQRIAEIERQRREETLRLQAEEQRRIAEAARLRAEEEQRLARLQEADDEKRQLEEILARRKAEREALDAERRDAEVRENERLESERLEQERQERIRLERERLAREQTLLEAERQRAEAARQEAERLRVEQERLQAEAEARAERERRMAEIAAAERQRLAEVEANRLAREQLLAERERAASLRRRDKEQLRRKELRVARIAELSDAAGFGAKADPVERTPPDREDLAEKLERKAERTSIITRLMEDFRIADWRAVEPQLLREDGDRKSDEAERRVDEEDPPSNETVRRPSTAQQRPRVRRRTQPPQPEPKPRVARNDDARASRSSRPRRQAQPAPPTRSAETETFRASRSNVGGPRRYSVKDAWEHDGSRTAGWARRFPPIGTGCADERAGRSIVPPGTYVVALGDTLWQISWKHYQRGDLYRKIYRANRRKIRSINRIYPCQKIFVPALSR